MEWEPQGKETLCKMLPQEKQGKTKSLGSFLFHSRPQSPRLSPTGQTWPDTSWPKILALQFPATQSRQDSKHLRAEAMNPQKTPPLERASLQTG